jgi:predicted RNA binding protein YcfA (HicA-like mRNA interferase family)
MTPELSSLNGHQILKALLKAGFEHTRTDGDHAFLANKKTQRIN